MKTARGVWTAGTRGNGLQRMGSRLRIDLWGWLSLFSLMVGCIPKEQYVKQHCSQGTLRECLAAVEKYADQAGRAADELRPRCDAGGKEECAALFDLLEKAGRSEDLLQLAHKRCYSGSDAESCRTAARLQFKKGEVWAAVEAITVACVRANMDACRSIKEMALQCEDATECGKVADAIQGVQKQVQDPDVSEAHLAVVMKLCNQYKVPNSCDNAGDNLIKREPPQVADALHYYGLACSLERVDSCTTYAKLLKDIDLLCMTKNHFEACEFLGTLLTDPEQKVLKPDLAAGKERLLRACRGGRAKACDRCADFIGCCPAGEARCRRRPR